MKLEIESDTYLGLLVKAEKQIIERALIASDYNITRTAYILNMSRNTLRKRINIYNSL